MARLPLKSKHWRGTDGAQTVETEPLEELRIAVTQAVEEASIIVVNGVPGTGRTFAIRTILEDMATRSWFLPIGPDSSGKQFEIQLLQEIYKTDEPGRRVDRTRLRGDLRDDLREYFAAEQCAYVIDDFQVSGPRGGEVVCTLFESDGNQAAFILVGNALVRMLRTIPALWSRVTTVVPFPQIPCEAIVTRMKEYHPFYERSAPEELLASFDHHKGNFRALAIFTAQVLRLAAESDRTELDEELRTTAVAWINKHTPDDASEAS